MAFKWTPRWWVNTRRSVDLEAIQKRMHELSNKTITNKGQQSHDHEKKGRQ